MFNFFKKKTEGNVVPPPMVKISDDEIVALKTSLAEKLEQLKTLLAQTESDKTAIAKHYESMGLIVAKFDKDQAIDYFEKSLSYQLTIGDGYKQLMSLYNQKRAEAAQNRDSDGIDKWMNKMDDMRQIAKQVIITG
ncbi:hypothetical protein GCM10023211_03930 [Orbus sasakiae]|uniref:Tetratricopeptide repeat protein n=1 Tax=Orbus sasakiae TaxID=1078475 RepID=A0ABP9N501_9GAMM